MSRRAIVAVALTLGLAAGAHAQNQGDKIQIDTANGPVEGVLIDRLPNGYLVNKGKATVVVPYTSVRGISRVGAPAPASVPAPAPLPTLAAPAPVPAPAAAEALSGPPGLAIDPAPVAAPPAAAGGEFPVAVPAPPAVPAPVAPEVVPVQALPTAPTAVPLVIRTHRRSTGLMAAGIILTGLGALTFVSGALVYLNGESQPTQTCDYYNSGSRCYANPAHADRMDTGGKIIFGGLVAVGAGIPLWVIGSKQVPDEHAEAQALVPTLAIGPSSAQMTLKF